MIITATAPIAGIDGSRRGSISAPAGPIALANGLNVTAGLATDDAPCCDLVIVTGGPGWAVQAPAALEHLVVFMRHTASRRHVPAA
jgi:hypothetical protein